LAVDVHQAGGIPLILKKLICGCPGLIDEEQMTPSGRTVAEEAKAAKETPGHEVIRSPLRPSKKTGGLVILKGNLTPEGCVTKITGHERLYHRGSARVFNSEEDAMRTVLSKRVKPGDVVVIRFEGPLGGPGIRETLEASQER
jgi:dihydroxy-acid dehydratase